MNNRSRKELYAFLKGFYVDCKGSVYNKANKTLSGCVINGYQMFSIRYKDGATKKHANIKTHRFIALMKYGSLIYQDGIVVRHLNGNPLDNSWNNIAIGTDKDNSYDIPIERRMQRTLVATSFCKKYSDEQVLEILEYHKKHKSYKKTKEKFNITSNGTLHYILNYRLALFN